MAQCRLCRLSLFLFLSLMNACGCGCALTRPSSCLFLSSSTAGMCCIGEQSWVASLYLDCENAGMKSWPGSGHLTPGMPTLHCPNASAVVAFKAALQRGDIFFHAFAHDGERATRLFCALGGFVRLARHRRPDLTSLAAYHCQAKPLTTQTPHCSRPASR